MLTIAAVCILSLYSLNYTYSVPLNLGIPAMRSGLLKLEQWTPVMSYLERKCGFEIEWVILKDHETLYNGLLNKYFDIGFMNALWEQRSNQESVLRSAARAEVGGKNYFKTFIIVNKDSVMRSLSDLGGEYLAVTVPYESFGGFYIPLVLLLEGGVNPDEAFREIIHSETYSSILKGVAFGVVDAGAVASSVLETSEMEQYSEEVRIIAQSKKIPQWAMVVQKSIKEDKIESFIKELTSMHEDEEGRQLLEKAGYSSFSIISDQNFSSRPSKEEASHYPDGSSEKGSSEKGLGENGSGVNAGCIPEDYLEIIEQINANKN